MGVTRCIARLNLEVAVGLFSCVFNEQITTDYVRITRIQIMICLIYVMVKYICKFVLGKCLNLQNKCVKKMGTSLVLLFSTVRSSVVLSVVLQFSVVQSLNLILSTSSDKFRPNKILKIRVAGLRTKIVNP